MSTAWCIGFVVGILIAVMIIVVLARIARRRDGAKGAYDERQVAARGRAYCIAYFTLLIYLAVWMVLRTLDIPFFATSLSVLLGALLSIAVFVGYSIFHDAYFKASESPRTWIGVLCGIGGMNLALGIIRLFREEGIEERLYNNVNLFVGALLVFVLSCVIIKRAMDRRGEEE